jgi:exodeoxyribonuclease X
MRIKVCDLETTGTEKSDAVVEIATWDLVDGRVAPTGHAQLINPKRPIPPEVSAIHHIIDDDVRDSPTFEHCIAYAMLGDVDAFCAHNAKFERQWITDEMTGGKPWICTLRCAYRVWPDAPGHSNQALRYWLKPEGLDRQIASVSHRAGPDAYVTAFTLRELLKKATFEQLVAWSAEPAILPRVPFGKHRGMAWKDVPIDYLSWVMRQTDMDEDVIATAKHWLRK